MRHKENLRLSFTETRKQQNVYAIQEGTDNGN